MTGRHWNAQEEEEEEKGKDSGCCGGYGQRQKKEEEGKEGEISQESFVRLIVRLVRSPRFLLCWLCHFWALFVSTHAYVVCLQEHGCLPDCIPMIMPFPFPFHFPLFFPLSFSLSLKQSTVFYSPMCRHRRHRLHRRDRHRPFRRLRRDRHRPCRRL